MAKKENDQEPNIDQSLGNVQIGGGLNTDSSLVNQPPGTTRFVMTGVDETKEGDLGTVSTEESNEACYTLPKYPNNISGTPYIPLGKVYIGEDNFLLFLGHPSGNSIICELDKECDLIVHVDDSEQIDKLGFRLDQQIDATFRLRRGCERSVYWVDPKPRLFILDKPEDFKTDLGAWDVDRFNLFKSYKKIPHFEQILVLDNGGSLAPGSYNFSIRYLDEDFNPTEFISSTETIMIYNSASTLDYPDIEGATKEVNDSYLNYPNSNKAIKIVLDPNTLDTNYPFYQIAITEANAGGGLISATKLTQEISTQNSTFYYTGTNFESEVSQEELTIFNNIIEKAQSIEQIENRLILGDVEGPQINFCKLQKYASKISADVVTRQVALNSLDDINSKNPSVHFNGIGYQPGEIYSFGIVYIFKGNTVSPAYHIPGKSGDAEMVYSPAENVYPMAITENTCQDTQYIEDESCGVDNYWGKDCNGNPLANTPVRHHRFPLRTDIGIPFVEKQTSENLTELNKLISIKATATGISVPVVCEDETDTTCAEYSEGDPRYPLTVQIKYTEDTVEDTFTEPLSLEDYVVGADEDTTADLVFDFTSSNVFADVVEVLEIVETLADGTTATIALTGPTSVSSSGMDVYTVVSTLTDLTYTITVLEGVINTSQDSYVSTILGVKFSNIVLPEPAEVDGKEITGYYIVRNERKESDRTVVGSAVLTPTIQEKHFVSQGLLFPQFELASQFDTKIKKDFVGFISPEHKFNGEEYSSFYKIIQQGKFTKEEAIYSRTKINDVADGSGYVSGKHKRGMRDNDGFSLHIKTRDNRTVFEDATDINFDSNSLRSVFYLNALEDKELLDRENKPVDVFNLACDNKIGILSLRNNYDFGVVNSLPYVYLFRQQTNPYSNFRLDPYYKESRNPQSFTTSTCEIFNGDSYISPMRYVNSIYHDTRMRKRAGKTNAWNFIIAYALVVVAVVATIFSFGALGPASVAAIIAAGTIAAGAIGIATALTLSGIKQIAWNKAYSELYNAGLRDTITDHYVLVDKDPVSGEERGFRKNPSDDEIQWLGECANLWFESSVNMNLRHGATDSTPDFLGAPKNREEGTNVPEGSWEYFGIYSITTEDIKPTTSLDSHMVSKLTIFDAKRKGYKSYIGLAAAEMYLLNPDYTRRNKQKFFNHLALEYDCCSDCTEKFPHRWHWSEQAFQEEITDNFRMFLPNNYKDLEAETGRITDIFRIQNNLYIHTEEGLWHCPQSFQERVTGDVISFIGTGEYFSIPPRKMVDDNNSSAGNKHKWGRTKTKYGVLFPSVKEKKWYLFNGEQLQPISDNGNSSWFKTHMDFLVEQDYYNANREQYPYSNNPSNPLGVGFISTYDTNKERLIVTKKDFKLLNLPAQDYQLCLGSSAPIIFENISETIADKVADGWDYIGIQDCELAFQRKVTTTETITREIQTWVPPVPGGDQCVSPYTFITEVTMTVSATNIGSSSAGLGMFSYGYLNCEGEMVVLGTNIVPYSGSIELTFKVGDCTAEVFLTYIESGSDAHISGIDYTYDLSQNCVPAVDIPGYYETTTVTEEVEIETVEYDYISGTPYNLAANLVNNSWTMSYSLKRQEWRSWHPYLPSFYLHNQEKFYSWPQGSNSLWRHNRQGHYRTFYGTTYPFIVEYVDNPQLLSTKLWSYMMFQTEAKQFDATTQEYNDIRNTTFNKVLFYNTEQISGVLNITTKANDSSNYLLQQTQNTLGSGSILADRNERDWTLNDMRDIRTTVAVPLFIKELNALQSNYYIDKIVNPACLSYTKSWNELESFRDKFLVVRLIFDTFDTNKRLTFYYSSLNKNMSER